MPSRRWLAAALVTTVALATLLAISSHVFRRQDSRSGSTTTRLVSSGTAVPVDSGEGWAAAPKYEAQQHGRATDTPLRPWGGAGEADWRLPPGQFDSAHDTIVRTRDSERESETQPLDVRAAGSVERDSDTAGAGGQASTMDVSANDADSARAAFNVTRFAYGDSSRTTEPLSGESQANGGPEEPRTIADGQGHAENDSPSEAPAVAPRGLDLQRNRTDPAAAAIGTPAVSIDMAYGEPEHLDESAARTGETRANGIRSPPGEKLAARFPAPLHDEEANLRDHVGDDDVINDQVEGVRAAAVRPPVELAAPHPPAPLPWADARDVPPEAETCSDGSVPYECLVDPCSTVRCRSGTKCISSRCGGCSARCEIVRSDASRLDAFRREFSSAARFRCALLTDTPLYRPGDTIRATAVFVNAVTGVPLHPLKDLKDWPRAWGAQGVGEGGDPDVHAADGGLRRARFGVPPHTEASAAIELVREGRTSDVVASFEEHNVAKAMSGPLLGLSLKIPAGIGGGVYRLRARVEGGSHPGMPSQLLPCEATTLVRPFSDPRFRVSIELDRSTYEKGALVRASVRGTEIGGAALAGASAHLVGRLAAGSNAVVLDKLVSLSAADGTAHIEFSIPQEHAKRILVTITVNHGGHVESATAVAAILTDDSDRNEVPSIRVYCEGGTCVEGAPARIYASVRSAAQEPVSGYALVLERECLTASATSADHAASTGVEWEIVADATSAADGRVRFSVAELAGSCSYRVAARKGVQIAAAPIPIDTDGVALFVHNPVSPAHDPISVHVSLRGAPALRAADRDAPGVAVTVSKLEQEIHSLAVVCDDTKVASLCEQDVSLPLSKDESLFGVLRVTVWVDGDIAAERLVFRAPPSSLRAEIALRSALSETATASADAIDDDSALHDYAKRLAVDKSGSAVADIIVRTPSGEPVPDAALLVTVGDAAAHAAAAPLHGRVPAVAALLVTPEVDELPWQAAQRVQRALLGALPPHVPGDVQDVDGPRTSEQEVSHGSDDMSAAEGAARGRRGSERSSGGLQEDNNLAKSSIAEIDRLLAVQGWRRFLYAAPADYLAEHGDDSRVCTATLAATERDVCSGRDALQRAALLAAARARFPAMEMDIIPMAAMNVMHAAPDFAVGGALPGNLAQRRGKAAVRMAAPRAESAAALDGAAEVEAEAVDQWSAAIQASSALAVSHTLRTDREGRSRLPFVVPSSTGAVDAHVLALASSSFGEAAVLVPVSRALRARLRAPPAATAADVPQVTVTVENGATTSICAALRLERRDSIASDVVLVAEYNNVQLAPGAVVRHDVRIDRIPDALPPSFQPGRAADESRFVDLHLKVTAVKSECGVHDGTPSDDLQESRSPKIGDPEGSSVPHDSESPSHDDASVAGEKRADTETAHASARIRAAPAGYPVRHTTAGVLTADLPTLSFTVAPQRAGARPQTISVQASAFPAPSASLAAALEALIREPTGCFEQTAATLYPMALARAYLAQEAAREPASKSNAEGTSTSAAALVRRADALISPAIARLASFECDGGGFEWFGEGPGHESLTAFGVAVLSETASALTSNAGNESASMRKRASAWLRTRVRPSGRGFERNPKSLDTFGRAPDGTTDAYILWSLALAGQEVAPAQLEHLRTLSTQAPADGDPYFLALAAGAHAALAESHARAKGPEEEPAAAPERELVQQAEALLRRALAFQEADGRVAQAVTSITASHGRNLDVETSAVTAIACLLLGNSWASAAETTVRWLISQCDGGRFGATQGTALALKALVMYSTRRSQAEYSTLLSLQVGDASATDPVAVSSSSSGGPVVVEADQDKAAALARAPEEKAEHSISVRAHGGPTPLGASAALPVELSVAYYAKQPDTCGDSPVGLAVRIVAPDRGDEAGAHSSGHLSVQEGDALDIDVVVSNAGSAAAAMTVAIVGLPGGVEVDAAELERLRKRRSIDFYEIFPGMIHLYWRGIDASASARVVLPAAARFVGKYEGLASQAYLYYDDTCRSWAPGTPLYIEPRESPYKG